MKPIFIVLFSSLLLSLQAQNIDTLAFQDFEVVPQSPVWGYTGTPTFNSGTTSASASPPNSPIGIGSSRAWEITQVSSGVFLDFANQSLPTGYDSFAIVIRVAGMNLNGSTGGPDNLDWVLASLSTDAGTTFYDRLRIRGAVANNSTWAYSATGVADVFYQPQSEAVFQPANSGLQTTQGFSTARISMPGSLNQIMLRLGARSSSSSDTWLIDNVMLIGYTQCTSSADFTSSATTICPGDTVSFTNTSSNATAYQWSVDGMAMSTATNYAQAFPSPGSYTVSLQATGALCSPIHNEVITVSTPPSGAASFANPTCAGAADGAASVVPSGTSPFSYQWSTGGTTQTITALTAGVYEVSITDAVGCTGLTSMTLSDPSAINSTATATSNYNGFEVSCANAIDGEANVSANGGNPPYSYLWSNGSTTAFASGLAAGGHAVTVTDANNCGVSDSLNLSAPTAITVSFSALSLPGISSCVGELQATAGGGISPYSYVWSDPAGQTTTTATGLCVGTYTVTITDANGCEYIDSFSLRANTNVVELPTIFKEIRMYPNPVAQQLTIEKLPAHTQLTLLNTVGQVVHQGQIQRGGTYQLDRREIPAGMYILRLQTGEMEMYKKLSFR